jgi:hypothetical protein
MIAAVDDDIVRERCRARERVTDDVLEPFCDRSHLRSEDLPGEVDDVEGQLLVGDVEQLVHVLVELHRDLRLGQVVSDERIVRSHRPCP